ncbi:MAG: response regulator transcription factor [Rhodospirillales bacterium]|nr:response regulator transcription factor [Rhodospirillales bacterium]
MHLLLVEDDTETARYVATALERAGHTVAWSADGREALDLARNASFDVLIVDRMLPAIDGVSLVRQLRGEGGGAPVLFLSALAGIDDRVTGLEAGGDDYLIKPFAIAELLARVSALGRRSSTAESPTRLRVADLELDLIRRTATRSGDPIDLLPREFELLEFLMCNAGKVVTKTMLLERVWKFTFDPKTTVVETHVSRLRNKIDKGFAPELIHTVRGVGYCLRGLA